MDRRRFSLSCSLLLILSILSFHPKVISGNTSVLFLNGPTRQYVRQPSDQNDSPSASEIGAIASVLLGFAPPSSLSAAGSAKLNEVLIHNPIDRPRALLILEVTGVEEFPQVGSSNNVVSVKINDEDDQKVDIHIPDEDEVYVASLNGMETVSEFSDKEISDFASWLDGSYIEDKSGPLRGVLIIPTANGAFLRFHLTEESDKKFIVDLLFLVNGIRDAKYTHEMLANRAHSPAELINGRFDGIKVLQDRYGKVGIAQNGLDVFFTAVLKAFHSLASSYEGKIVGVIGYGFRVETKSGNMFHVSVPSKSSARALQQTELPPEPSEVAKTLSVATTLAWITGIILLIATLLGVHFLLNMPLTKDPLLYSNVKLD